jgi:phosphate transport system substrate-binding protein
LGGGTAAAAGAAGNIKADLRATIVDAPGNGAYPISGFTWILAYKTMDDKPKAVALTRMLWWATHDAQQFNAELGYAPVPQEIVARGEGLIQQISSGGQPAFPGR